MNTKLNEENQVYFIDSDTLPESALARKHSLEQDPSSRTNHMEYMKGMQVIESDIKDKVLRAMDEFDYDFYTANDVERAL
nr:2-iminoacetate synthase ThiH [Lachnospiraceae bacterium]